MNDFETVKKKLKPKFNQLYKRTVFVVSIFVISFMAVNDCTREENTVESIFFR